MSSLPIRDLNDLPEDPSLRTQSQSQTQHPRSETGNVPSSPLFFPTSSSNPGSEANNHRGGTVDNSQRSRIGDVSSPCITHLPFIIPRIITVPIIE